CDERPLDLHRIDTNALGVIGVIESSIRVGPASNSLAVRLLAVHELAVRRDEHVFDIGGWTTILELNRAVDADCARLSRHTGPFVLLRFSPGREVFDHEAGAVVFVTRPQAPFRVHGARGGQIKRVRLRLLTGEFVGPNQEQLDAAILSPRPTNVVYWVLRSTTEPLEDAILTRRICRQRFIWQKLARGHGQLVLPQIVCDECIPYCVVHRRTWGQTLVLSKRLHRIISCWPMNAVHIAWIEAQVLQHILVLARAPLITERCYPRLFLAQGIPLCR